MGTNRSTVIFNNNFKLRAFAHELSAGTYEISVADGDTDAAPNQGLYRISTMICTPCIERQGGPKTWTGVNASELAEALRRDAQTVTRQSHQPQV